MWPALEPLSQQQLRRLEQHRYSATGRSVLEGGLHPWWCWLVCRTPLWVAPNLITVSGLACNAATTLLLAALCPTATEAAPRWVYSLCALGLFIYQSLDAIDGKQARRTGSSSPLGELFDHGCDAISTVLLAMGVVVTLRLGTDCDLLFLLFFLGVFMFYCAHWQTYVTGTMRFGKIDVTEVQLVIVGIFLLAAACGPDVWDHRVPVLDMRLKLVPVLLEVLASVFTCFTNFHMIFTGGVGKNGSTIAGTSVISPAFHIGTVVVLAAMIAKKSPSSLFERNPCLYILTFGCVAAKITNKLVVAHMTRSEMFLQDTAFLGPGLLFLNQYCNCFVDEFTVLLIALVLSMSDLLFYCVAVCHQISTHLRIHVFKIAPSVAHTSTDQHTHLH